MLLKVFNTVALGGLYTLLFGKRGKKRLSPLGLRVYLGILATLSWLLNTPLIAVFAGSWALFLVIGDISRLCGIRLWEDCATSDPSANSPVDQAPQTSEPEVARIFNAAPDNVSSEPTQQKKGWKPWAR